MDKKSLSVRVSQSTGLTQKDALAAVNATLAAVTAALAQGESVTLAGFGTFEVASRAARTARNLRTGETMTVQPTKIAVSRPSPALKAAVEEANET